MFYLFDDTHHFVPLSIFWTIFFELSNTALPQVKETRSFNKNEHDWKYVVMRHRWEERIRIITGIGTTATVVTVTIDYVVFRLGKQLLSSFVNHSWIIQVQLSLLTTLTTSCPFDFVIFSFLKKSTQENPHYFNIIINRRTRLYFSKNGGQFTREIVS